MFEHGLELLKEVKDHVPSTECVVVTGHASQQSAIEAINLGAYSYLQKPFDVREFIAVIREILDAPR